MSSQARDSTGRWWIAPLVYAGLTAIVLGPELVASRHRVLSSPGTDLTLQFLAWRHFGFTELSHGNLPLWNPHVYGGAPYFAGFQAALLYPPNWLHLILSLGPAINWIIALHVFAAGYFMYLWCRRRAGVAGSLIGGAMLMFCGPYFLHIYAGHLPHVAVMVWIPLILLAIDGLSETRSRAAAARWWLLGTVAVSMQILAGHPQYVYYTGIVATIYFGTLLIVNWRTSGWRPVVGFVGMYLCAILLTAIQLFPGIAATSETVRSGGLPYSMAGTFSLPPENFLTLFAPDMLGMLATNQLATEPAQQYFGRTYLWESSLFVSLCGLVLAAYGACVGGSRKARIVALAMVLACILLALGRHTPLYWLMYKLVPQYGSFRGTVKFAALAVPFVAVLAAIGFDRLLEIGFSRRLTIAATILTVTLGITAGVLETSSRAGRNDLWGGVLRSIASSRSDRDDNELFAAAPNEAYGDANFIRETGHLAAKRMMFASIVAALVVLGLFGMKLNHRLAVAMPLIAVVELLIFARGSIATTSAQPDIPQTWLDALANAPADVRVLVTDFRDHNDGMYYGFNNVWGYDPGVLKRYAELMTYSQGGDPDRASQYLLFHRLSLNIFRAIRCGYIFQYQVREPVVEVRQPLPTAVLVRNYRVAGGRDQILAALADSDFDPRSTVMLEKEPEPKPVKGNSIGTVEVVKSTTDSLRLRVDIETPAILLITNNYCGGWQARSEGSGNQGDYEIQPANWAQQAIALQAGQHSLVVEYRPLSFRVGRWVSVSALIGLGVGTALIPRRGQPEQNTSRRTE